MSRVRWVRRPLRRLRRPPMPCIRAITGDATYANRGEKETSSHGAEKRQALPSPPASVCCRSSYRLLASTYRTIELAGYTVLAFLALFRGVLYLIYSIEVGSDIASVGSASTWIPHTPRLRSKIVASHAEVWVGIARAERDSLVDSRRLSAGLKSS